MECKNDIQCVECNGTGIKKTLKSNLQEQKLLQEQKHLQELKLQNEAIRYSWCQCREEFIEMEYNPEDSQKFNEEIYYCCKCGKRFNLQKNL